jgi:hypothetical protein
VTYNTSPQAAAVSGSVPGTVGNVKYSGSATVPTNAATYAVTADFAPADSANYHALTGASAGNFVIEKATPTLAVTNSPVTYNTSPQAAAVSGSVPGMVGSVKYSGSATVPTNAATYAVTADFAPTDSANYNALAGASAGNFVIEKATPTLAVTNSPVTYNTSPQAAAVSGSVPGTVGNVKYSGSATVPTNAATYAVTADFAPTDSANYNALAGASAGNFVIEKATPTLAVTNSPVTYNTSPQAAAVSGSVPGTVGNVKYSGSATVPTNAATYAVTADFAPTDSANYHVLTGASAGNFVIEKATPTLAVTNSPVIYNTSPQAAAVGGSVPGTVSYVRYNGSATVPTNAATYAVSANFAPTDSTNYRALTGASAGNFMIEKATPTLAVTNSPVTYNTSPQAAAVSGSVPGTVGNVKYNGLATVPTNAATYAVTADFGPTDSANYNALASGTAGNFVIQKATPTLTVTNSPVTYNGSAQAAAVGGSVPGTVTNIKYNGSLAVPMNAAMYAVIADFVPTDATNYNVLTGAVAGNFVINKATPTINVIGYTVPYDTLAHTATGTAKGVLNESVAGLNLSGTTHTAVGSWNDPWSFTDSTGNYNNASGTVAVSITAWSLTGFYSPVAVTSASGPNVWNLIKGGSTVPLKFNIYRTLNGTELTSESAVQGGSVSVYSATCVGGVYNDDTNILMNTGGTQLRYDGTGGQFIQNWQTPKGAGKCYAAVMTAADGSRIQALFQAK